MSPKHLLIAIAILAVAGLAAVVILKPSGGSPLSLLSAKGTVQLASEPGDAEIWIDGARKGNTPADKGMTFAINLPEGTHKLEFVLPKDPVRWIADKELVVTADTVQPVTLTLAEDVEARKAWDDAEAKRKVTEEAVEAKRKAVEEAAEAKRKAAEEQVKLTELRERLMHRAEATRGAPIPAWATSSTFDPYGIQITLPHKGGLKMNFRWLPPGNFLMGSPIQESGRQADESLHEVNITKGFWAAETEVTESWWTALSLERPDEFSNNPNYPVRSVSWEKAQEFISLLNRSVSSNNSGWLFSLPTEAQWEYACRAGTSTPYCVPEGSRYNVANFNSHSSHPDPVGKLNPNDAGLFDMHGNVSEWCLDWYGDYSMGNAIDPIGPKYGKKKVTRGGGWPSSNDSVRSAARKGDYGGFYCGFRLFANYKEP